MYEDQLTEEELMEAAKALEMQSLGYKNFDTSQDDFDPTMGMDEDFSVLNLRGRFQKYKGMEPRGQITYDLQINYVSVAGNPVNVTLFRNLFNTGTFVGDDLVFTNATADTATVVGITVPFRALQIRSETEQFRVNFARMNVVAASQFGQRWQFQQDSVWGGGSFNNLTPKTFITPEQFQLLRVDVPMFYDIDSERGWNFDVLSDNTVANGGLQITLFIDRIVNQTRALKGKNPVMNLTGPGIMDQSAVSADPIQVAKQIIALRNTSKPSKRLQA